MKNKFYSVESYLQEQTLDETLYTNNSQYMYKKCKIYMHLEVQIFQHFNAL